MTSPNTLRKWIVLASLAATPALVACGSDDPDVVGDTGNDTDVIDDSGDTGLDADPDTTPDADPDVEPDVQPDVPADVEPDSTEPPVGACLNEADQTILETVDVTGEAQTCGLGCLGDADPGTCAGECVATETGLSEDCAGCYSGIVVCSIDNCLASCAADPSSEACTTCQAENCLEDFNLCVGTPPPGNIIEVLTEAGDYTLLLAAIEDAGLTAALSDAAADLTLFAPNDAAFTAAEIPEDIAVEALTEVLLYHTVAGITLASGLIDGPVMTGAEFSAWINLEDGAFINDALVIEADLEASNGVVHGINTVLMPLDLVELADVSGEFTTLLGAAVTANLDGLLGLDDGVYTIFAPNDAAFGAFEGTLPTDPDELAAVLSYHAVIGEQLMAADLTATFYPSAIDFAWTFHPGGAEGSWMVNQANILTRDVVGINGVLHVIDAVLAPATTTQLLGWHPGYSTLTGAVTTADLSASIDADGTTLFAPNNAAFEAVDTIPTGAELVDLLEGHLVSTAVVLETAMFPVTLSSADATTLNVTSTEGVVQVNGINVIMTDITTFNGMLHTIAGVLLPPI